MEIHGSQEENVFYPDSRSAIIGGTFDILHQGHKEYIQLAFDFAHKVHILLRTNGYAQNSKLYQVKSYEERHSQLFDYLKKKNFENRCCIHPLKSENYIIDFCTDHPEIGLAVIVPEYYQLFERVNKIREQKSLNSLLLLIKQRTKTTDGDDLSSTKINKKNPGILNDSTSSAENIKLITHN